MELLPVSPWILDFRNTFLRIGFQNKVCFSAPRSGFNRIWTGFSELDLVSTGFGSVSQGQVQVLSDWTASQDRIRLVSQDWIRV